jgi:LPXTG-site transpeptidase (sortase) family protein
MNESRDSTSSGRRRQPVSMMRRIATALGLLAIVVAMTASVAAQGTIESTEVGEMPTSGGMRPGPIGLQPEEPVRREGVLPVAIRIEKAGIEAEIETIEIVDGIMQNPTGPWIVSWYKETAKPGEIGNIVLAGHLDYWDVGAAVFYNIGLLEPADRIEVTGEDGVIYIYEVDWRENYDAANAPIQDIVGQTEDENLTLITCGGPFDYQTGEYLQRTVVRAHRVTE